MADKAGVEGQSHRFLLLYALAWAGGAIAYTPFLTILLPVRVSLVAGQGADVSWLAYIAFAGAVAASIGHIGFGYLSDLTRNRTRWIWAGMILSSGLLVAVNRADNLLAFVSLIVCWQLALNMMLAPLSAWAGDCVPDTQKGLLGGLMACAPGMGALSGSMVTIPGLASPDLRVVIVSLAVAGCVAPVLLAGRPLTVIEPPHASTPQTDPIQDPVQGSVMPAMFRMWMARLLVQIADAALFAYLYFWFRSMDPVMSDNKTARVFSVVLVLSAPLALLAGRWSDLRKRPVLPLVICAATSAAGLLGMALARDLSAAIGTYIVFSLATSVFLALHSAQTLRLLSRSDRRGRNLGLFNMTNTVPALIMPWITLVLVPQSGFAGLFLLFAVLALVASVLLMPLIHRK